MSSLKKNGAHTNRKNASIHTEKTKISLFQPVQLALPRQNNDRRETINKHHPKTTRKKPTNTITGQANHRQNRAENNKRP
jgi:hypothetical protein